jgi:hypothetical protein
MDLTELNNGEILFQHSEIGLVMQWLQTLVNEMEEKQFWDYFMELYNKGLSEKEKASIEVRRKMNIYLIPRDFGLLIDITFIEIITRNLNRLAKNGYPTDDIIVRAHIGGK